MFLKEFPDLHWLKQKIKEDFNGKIGWNNRQLENTGWPSVILNVKSREAERKDIKGPFSIFLNKSGRSRVGVENKSVLLNEDTYIITNHQEHYDLLIDNFATTETFNIHFGTKFCFDAFKSLKENHIKLLDEPENFDELTQIPFRSIFRDATFNKLINQLEDSYINDESREYKEEKLYELFQYIYFQNHEEANRIESLSSTKISTKEELIKRLYLGLDFIHSAYQENITLEEIAQHSYLSKFHFLRTFKEAFNASPYQYIKKLRIQKAIELIKESNLPINEISSLVGINNASSLSRMIYKCTGKYPTSIRTIK